MKRPSDWPLHFVLYPMMFRICPVPILAIIQEMSKEYEKSGKPLSQTAKDASVA